MYVHKAVTNDLAYKHDVRVYKGARFYVDYQ